MSRRQRTIAGIQAVGILAVIGAILLLAPLSSAHAKDLPFTLTEADQQSFALAGPLVEQCAMSAAMRGDVTQCRQIAEYLRGVAQRVKAAADEQAKAEPAK